MGKCQDGRPAREGNRSMRLPKVRLAIVLACLSLGVASPTLEARELQGAPLIFDVRINLPLEPDEQVHHDFYINAGAELGFKKGMFVSVVRPVPVHDPIQNKQQGTLNIGVARLQVIHVEKQLTVARLVAELTDDERPVLEFESVMIGDRIDLSSMTMEEPRVRKKKKGDAPPRAEARPEPPSDPATGPKTEAKPELKAETVVEKLPIPAPVEAEAKKPSPAAVGPDMVRVPVPPGSTRAL